MKFVVKHEIKGRIRVHFCQKRMTFEEADTLQYYLDSQEMITSSKVQERTQDATICYTGEKSAVIALLRSFQYEKVDVPDVYRQNSGRETNREYWDKLVTKVVVHYGNKLFLPMPIRTVITGVKSVKYIYQGIHTLLQRKIEVPVLDATAIGVSMFRTTSTSAAASVSSDWV